MAELADAHGSGPCEGYFMGVRIPLSAPNKKARSNMLRAFYLVSFSERSGYPSRFNVKVLIMMTISDM